MQYNIQINQVAIDKFRRDNNYKIDGNDAMIIDCIQKFCNSKFAQKQAIKIDDDIYYYLSYQLIIDQLPLLDIENKQVVSRRLQKLQEYGIIKIKIFKDLGNKTYITTTEILDSFYLKIEVEQIDSTLLTQKLIPYQPNSQYPIDSKVDTLLTQKLNNNITTNYDINNITKKETVSAKNAQTEEYLSLPEWLNLSEYEKQKTIWYINQRREDHGKSIKNTQKAVKPILSAILELKSKGLTIDDIIANIQDKNGCVYQTIKVVYFDNALRKINAQNNTNSAQNVSTYQTDQNNAQKVPLNDDPKSDDYFAYRFNDDIEPAFSYKECIELTETISKNNPTTVRYARTLALIEWLQKYKNNELSDIIKNECVDIYENGGYDVFVKKAIADKPDCRWIELLKLLFN